MTNAPQQPPAGWYPDPAGSDGQRYWDGVAWSQATRDIPAPHMPPTATHPRESHEQTRRFSPYSQPMSGQVGARTGAPFGWRVLGFLIDFIGITFISSLITGAAGLDEQMNGEMTRWMRAVLLFTESPTGPMPLPAPAFWSAWLYSALIGIAVFATYRTILLGTLSATLGQLAAGLRTVPVGAGAEARIGWGAAVLRGVFGAVLYQDVFVGLVNGIFAAFTRRRQTLSDMISKTQVLKIR